MDKTEIDFLNMQELQLFVWLGYIDDIFYIWTHGEAEPKMFMEELNKLFPNLKFTYESLKKTVAFLDLNISLENGSIATDLRTKSTDCHQGLHCTSWHSSHIKNSIIYNETLRLINVWMYKEDFHLIKMRWIWNHSFWRGNTQNRWLIHKWEKLNLVRG